MQHNHTKATHGHIGVGDAIYDAICLKFKRHQRFFYSGSTAHAQHTMPQEVIANGMSDTLGVFVMQHNHTNATHGHIDVGDVISDVFCLKFKRHRRLFTTATACAQHAVAGLTGHHTSVRTYPLGPPRPF
jgi:hypothetical protein